MQNDMMTTKLAAKILGVTTRRVVAMIQSNQLPAKKFGRLWILNGSDVYKFAKMHRPVGRPRKN